MQNEATAVMPQIFPVAMRTPRTIDGTQRSAWVKIGNRNGIAHTNATQSTHKMQVSALDTGAGSLFRSEKKRRAIRICVVIVTIVIRMSAIPGLLGDILVSLDCSGASFEVR